MQLQKHPDGNVTSKWKKNGISTSIMHLDVESDESESDPESASDEETTVQMTKRKHVVSASWISVSALGSCTEIIASQD